MSEAPLWYPFFSLFIHLVTLLLILVYGHGDTIEERRDLGENGSEMTTVAGFVLPKGFSNRSRQLFYLA